MQAIEWDKIRAQFPVLHQQVHGKPLVYLDNGASSQMPQSVIDRINNYHSMEHANIHRGVHYLSQTATDEYERTREKVRDLIHARFIEEIIFTTGTTDSINLVADSWGHKNLKEGDEIILSQMEHHANIVPWQLIAQKTGAVIKVIPMDESGVLDLEVYASLLNERTKMVALVHVSNTLGTVNPVLECCKLAKKFNAAVLIDGAQAVPHMPVDIQALNADFYAFSAHKMCGPTGFGVLYGKQELLLEMPPYRGGGDMIDRVSFSGTTFNDLPHKFEAGTPPIAAGIGFGESLNFLDSVGLSNIAAREHELLEYANHELSKIDGLQFIGTSTNKTSVISFLLDNIHPTDAGTIMDKYGVAVRTGHHCTQPIMEYYSIPGTIRASLSFYNNEQDIDALVSAVKETQSFFT
ncbi:MAG: cysteine desulfurase [Bacteroidetes bacterium]|nr:cysteine desulfurase [Bacteroidota bacterium]